MLKLCATAIFKPLKSIYKLHQLLPQFKEGDEKLLSSYRPKLLLPRCGKILGGCLYNSVGPEAKISTLFLFYILHIIVNFMEKELSTKFYVVLLTFHEVMKLQNFEHNIGDVIPVNVHNISGLFFAYLC